MARIPDQLGPVRLVRQIGTGRNCQVWEGREGVEGRAVAVKVVTPSRAGAAAERRLLQHELRVARTLDHPSVIRIDRYATEAGLPHLVMELYPHPNLKKLMATGAEPLAPLVQPIAVALAEALEHMHDRGWIHRDVKPENVLAAPDGRVKLIDLAIAARAAGFFGRLLGGTPPQGTPSYMSPEQIRGRPLDARSDIYSFGCVLFELIAGRPPFTASTKNDLLNRHIGGTVPALEAANRHTTPAAAELVRRMLAKRPADRPESMREVALQLRAMRLLERLP
jgi:serine/threonine protein kinase